MIPTEESLRYCDYSDNACFSKFVPIECNCVFTESAFRIQGLSSGSSWVACAVTYNSDQLNDPYKKCIGDDCLFQVIRGANSLLYPGSPIDDWIIGEQVSIVAEYEGASLDTTAYICGKTTRVGALITYDVLVLRCSPIPTPTCDKTYIQVIIPGNVFNDKNYSRICFRVGGTDCCGPGSPNQYSNTVCKALDPPVLPPPPQPPEAGIGFDDYCIIFADESLYPSAPNIFGYVNQSPYGTPNIYWYQDMDDFKLLDSLKAIDVNKILIFHVRSFIKQQCTILPLYPYINVPDGYQMPIPDSRIIPSSRNVPACIINNEPLTGNWINEKIKEAFGDINPSSQVNVFVDDSPSLGWSSVKDGVSEYFTIAKNNGLTTRRILCNSERWIRWIVSTFNKQPICS
jgi:hypothetical protein